MYLAEMRPEHIKDAVQRNVPVIMCAGVIEYHGPHLPVGTDIIIPAKIIEEIEKRCECIVAPHFPFGPTLNWAGGAEEGDVDFDVQPFYQYAKEVFRKLLQIGFRRIYVLHYHQSGGEQSLALNLATREACNEIARGWGEGWGRKESKAFPIPHIFSCIQIKDLSAGRKQPDDTKDIERIRIGHSGKGETQLVMAVSPELVNMAELEEFKEDEMPAWLKDAHEADAQQGSRWIEFCINAWVKELKSN